MTHAHPKANANADIYAQIHKANTSALPNYH